MLPYSFDCSYFNSLREYINLAHICGLTTRRPTSAKCSRRRQVKPLEAPTGCLTESPTLDECRRLQGHLSGKVFSSKDGKLNNIQANMGIGPNRISKDTNPVFLLGDWKSPICSRNMLAERLSMSNMVSPFAIHQQQIAMLKQQQSLLMSAAAKSGGVLPNFARNAQPPGANGTTLPTPNWPNVGFQFPGMMTPAAGNNELLKYMQQMGNMGSTLLVGTFVPFPSHL